MTATKPKLTVVFEETTKNYTKGLRYKAKYIFEAWPWMLMAWDNGGIGRYIHGGDFGSYRIT